MLRYILLLLLFGSVCIADYQDCHFSVSVYFYDEDPNDNISDEDIFLRQRFSLYCLLDEFDHSKSRGRPNEKRFVYFLSNLLDEFRWQGAGSNEEIIVILEKLLLVLNSNDFVTQKALDVRASIQGKYELLAPSDQIIHSLSEEKIFTLDDRVNQGTIKLNPVNSFE